MRLNAAPKAIGFTLALIVFTSAAHSAAAASRDWTKNPAVVQLDNLSITPDAPAVVGAASRQMHVS
jgi:hypothetical protein